MKRALAASAIGILTLLGSPATACAAERPIQVSIFTPAQLVPEEDGVRGLRLNLIYGRNKSVQGIDVGFVNRLTSGQSRGLQIGLVGMVDVDFCGAQLNVFNVFNHYHVLILPNFTTGWTAAAIKDATFDQQPRTWLWTNTISF